MKYSLSLLLFLSHIFQGRGKKTYVVSLLLFFSSSRWTSSSWGVSSPRTTTVARTATSRSRTAASRADSTAGSCGRIGRGPSTSARPRASRPPSGSCSSTARRSWRTTLPSGSGTSSWPRIRESAGKKSYIC